MTDLDLTPGESPHFEQSIMSSPVHTSHQIVRKVLPNWAYQRLLARWRQEGLKRYGSNTISLLAVRIFSSLVSLFVAVYLTRYLGPENYGQLSYALSFVGLFSILGSLGIDSVLYRELVQHPDQREVYLGSAFGIKAVAGIFAAMLSIVAALFLVEDDVSRVVIFILAGTFIFNAFNVINYEFQAQVQQKLLALASISVVVTLNVLKLLVIYFEQGVIYVAFILLFEAILYAVIFATLRARHYGPLTAWRFEPTIARLIIRDSWPFVFIAIFTTVYARIDQIMLKHLLDSTAVGLYDAAVRIAEAWLFIPTVIASSLFPAIVNGRSISLSEYKKRLFYLIALLALGSLLIVLPSFMFADEVIDILYGRFYLGSSEVFAVYVWSGVFVSINAAVQYFLLAERMHKTILFASCGTMIMNVALNMLWIPAHGIVGAAWATLVSYAFLITPIIFLYVKHE